ncbi:MAG TPA: DUF1659 domain-containing protein [Methylomusa anaerophila]|uniref:DUF1659 domain-containing protein n=1 Tax=Methylomusa anaerophila TaxID=1930071 RepID=A0A348AKT4_9FIRM|nr:DUF1659 domain-containing protein [Methylomusa anaerophila]BBB91682.1 hypothetical protein MAMMFC1_02366 [Methylomusa anaerophila]HML88585.1 DUF1659 domain-containing protein [Methylomusa anaerophila]
MAIVKVPQTGKLLIKVQTGLNTAGNPVYRQRTFANVKAGVSDDDLFAIGQGLGSLQQHTVSDITRVDAGNLVDQ